MNELLDPKGKLLADKAKYSGRDGLPVFDIAYRKPGLHGYKSSCS